MSGTCAPRVLFIDAYDSFSNNVISLLETILHADVTVIHIDSPITDWEAFLAQFTAVVAGPGPGDPRNPEDVGHFNRLWTLTERITLPVLGICLGFQSLVLAHGGSIHCLPMPRHGLVRTVKADGHSIFRNLSSLDTVQYHSLHAVLPSSRSGEFLPEKHEDDDLLPLAWESTTDSERVVNGDRAKNPDQILMAVHHRSKPFVGIQFHPESISSSHAARQVVANWWEDVGAWWREHPNLEKLPKLIQLANGELKEHTWPVPEPKSSITAFTASITPCNGRNGLKPHQQRSASPVQNGSKQERASPDVSEVGAISIELGELSVVSIVDLLQISDAESIILDSEGHQDSEVGRYSIVGLIEKCSTRFEYFIPRSKLIRSNGTTKTEIDLCQYQDDPFMFFHAFMEQHKVKDGPPEIPFWGGLMGYITYEASLGCLANESGCTPDLFPSTERSEHVLPSLAFAYVERSVVIDHARSKATIQSIIPQDRGWLDATAALLSLQAVKTYTPDLLKEMLLPSNTRITYPNEGQYKRRIRECKNFINAGDSYELCLTDSATVQIPKRMSAWPLYKKLRRVNPAPFASYIRLGRLSLLSGSPERFMRWARPVRAISNSGEGDHEAEQSLFQFRPIKGTVSRYDSEKERNRTLSEATALLSIPKEQAENLMIVDLIRHDLHGVVGSGRVDVPKLMVIEEYETVFQLVSVIEGRMHMASPRDTGQINGRAKRDASQRNGSGHTNGNKESRQRRALLDTNKQQAVNEGYGRARAKSSPVLALPATLPPGSMTGAPKLRSCQILNQLEQRPRGVYSGVVGYMDVGGGGDWSVSIRCAVRWDAPKDEGNRPTSSDRNAPNPRNSCPLQNGMQHGVQDGDTWTVGAGGAITALSTEEGEWQEMKGKLSATLRLFNP